MSGHSKWAKIKRSKGANDQKRGALFTKLARNITMAAQEGGGDPDMNFTLRLAIEKAKSANMPQDNIERAVKKGTGELQADMITRLTYEAVTQSGAMLLVDCATDNTNRTYSEVRNIVERMGEKLGASGSVAWQFAEEGQIELAGAKLQKSTKYGEKDSYVDADSTELEELIMETDGVIDYSVEKPDANDPMLDDTGEAITADFIVVRTEKTKLKEIAEVFNKAGWQVMSSSVVKNATNKIKLNPDQEEKLQSLIEQLDDHDDVDNVWTNVD